MYQTTITSPEILFFVISNPIDPATDQEGNSTAKPHYRFKEPQREMTGKEKEEKGNISRKTRGLKPMKLKEPWFLQRRAGKIWADQRQLPELSNGIN